MTSYRVAEELTDPLEVDEALCGEQREKEQRAQQIVATFATLGFWLPVMLVWLTLSQNRRTKFASGYRVRVRDGVLTAGNRSRSRSVPLDAIADASVLSGKVSVSVVGGTALVIYGLRDPEAAVHTILQARRSYMSGVGDGAVAHVRVDAGGLEERPSELREAREQDLARRRQ